MPRSPQNISLRKHVLILPAKSPPFRTCRTWSALPYSGSATRADGRYTAAGVCMSSASCGRTSLYSRRKRSKLRCCARRLTAGAAAVSAFNLRCMRSCRPFCSGCPAAMRSGTMPVSSTPPPAATVRRWPARQTALGCRCVSPAASRARETPLRRWPAPARCSPSPLPGSAADNGCAHP